MDKEKIFPNAINKYFKFLLDAGFFIYDKVECDTSMFGNGYYRFKSEKVGLEIILDRGQILMTIGKITQDRRNWLEWSYILKAYAPNIKAYDFDLDVDVQVKRISELLQQYGTGFLNGDFNDKELRKQN